MSLFSRLGRRPEPPTGRRFGFAVIGLGHIARYFIEAVRDSPTCSVAALVSGDAGKARDLAAKYAVLLHGAYDAFEAICTHPAVDAVYLALPVSMHLEWTRRAAAAGKHVLCEKPMALTSGEARSMIDVCTRAGVLLSIAYRCPHSVTHQRLRGLVRGGVLGRADTLRIASGFGYVLKPGWRDTAAVAGGGSLFDVGIYPLNAARFLLGEDPVTVRDIHATVDANGLERSIAWTSVFPSGAAAACSSSFEARIPDTLQVSGEYGSLMMAPAFGHRECYALQGNLLNPATNAQTPVHEKTPTDRPSEFRLEAEQLAAAAAGFEPLVTPGEDGLADMVAMEAIYAAAGMKQLLV